MEFTCIKCEFKFHHTLMDVDERTCYDCLEKDEDSYDYGPPYSMANLSGDKTKGGKSDRIKKDNNESGKGVHLYNEERTGKTTKD